MPNLTKKAQQDAKTAFLEGLNSFVGRMCDCSTPN